MSLLTHWVSSKAPHLTLKLYFRNLGCDSSSISKSSFLCTSHTQNIKIYCCIQNKAPVTMTLKYFTVHTPISFNTTRTWIFFFLPSAFTNHCSLISYFLLLTLFITVINEWLSAITIFPQCCSKSTVVQKKQNLRHKVSLDPLTVI